MAEERGQVLYSWEAAEFEPSRRDARWYWWAGGLIVILAGLLIWLNQWYTLAVLVMGAIVLWLMGKMQPRKFLHSLTDKGVVVGERFWPYSAMRSFWIVRAPDRTALQMLPNRKYALALTLQLASADVEKVRAVLAEYLVEEEERPEDVVDRIGRFLKL